MSDPILGQSLHCECVFNQYAHTHTHTQPHPQIITMNPSLLLAQRKKKGTKESVGRRVHVSLENPTKSCDHRHNHRGGGGLVPRNLGDL